MVSDSLLLRGGRIFSTARAVEPATALLIQHGRVRWIGDPAELGLTPAAEVDVRGRTVLPGLIDAHLHLEHYARRLTLIDCELPTKRACLEAVAAVAAQLPPGEWVLGHGWNQNVWEEYGSAAELDRAAPHHPAYLTAKSLHAAWANTAALKLAEIDRDTPDPEGGSLQRDPRGKPTGILFESAMRLVSRSIPEPDPGQLAELLIPAQSRLLEHGLTGVHDFDGPRCLQALQILRERGELQLRVVKNVPAEALAATQAAGLRSGFGDEWIRLGNVKAFADGALGPRTAAMLSAYLDEPENRGILLMDREAVSELGIQAAQAGFGLSVHAIGDQANHEVLEGLRIVREYEHSQLLPARRHRIEHLQLLHPDDASRPAELSIVASMQPIHATSDMQMADRAWGDRARYAYAWQSQRLAGATLAFGSDAPVEDPNPFLGLHAALTRRRSGDPPGGASWFPEEALAWAEALAAYTEGAAFAGGTEQSQGRLQPGYLADLIVLDHDPRQLEPDRIAELTPVGVMVGGRWMVRSF